MGGGVENTQTKCVGFTLAELLAVIAILGVIALIAFPAVNKIIKSSKEKAYESQKEIILSSAKNWGLDHLGELSEVDDTYLTIEELKRDGYLEAKQVVNPKTDEEMTGCIIVHYDDSYNQYVYEYNEIGCSEASNLPIITLNGNRTMSIELNGTYTELGATATYQGEDISSSIVITGSVDTSKAGTYYIKYNVTHNGVKAREVVRTIKVLGQGQTVDPGGDDPIEQNGITIALTPNGTTSYSKATTVNVTVKATGSNTIESVVYSLDGGEATEVVDNKIVLNTDGNHVLEVIATDNKGNQNKATSRIYQIDVTPPELHFSEEETGVTLTSSLVSLYNLKNGVSVVDNNSINIDNVIATGELSAKPGVYNITYKATDIAGNTTTKIRKITVVSDSGSGSGSGSSGGNILAGVVVSDADVMTNDPDKNFRYVGKDPNNYVKFNNELWRIIGVFDGQAKIIRNEPYNKSIAWHSSTSTNYWGSSSLQSELNSTFLKSINATSRSYIDTTHIWRLGGYNSQYVTRAEWYTYERGSLTYNNQTSVWGGAIGLMYPSDYGYSTGSTLPECDNAALYYWYIGDGVTCRDNSWLYNSSYNQWTITPVSSSTNIAFYVTSNGYVYYNPVTNTFAARPVLYLRSGVKITGGEGSAENPYLLGI